MKYSVVYSRQAQKDAKKIKKSNLKDSAVSLIKIIENDPYQNPPRFEQLRGSHEKSHEKTYNTSSNNFNASGVRNT